MSVQGALGLLLGSLPVEEAIANIGKGWIAMLQSAGRLGVAGENRILADLAPLVFDGFGFVYLIPGAYSITYNEVVHLPCDIMALWRRPLLHLANSSLLSLRRR